REPMTLDAPARAVRLFHAIESAGHVHRFPSRLILQIQWADHGRLRVLGTGEQRLEPSGTHEDVVLEKDDVRSLDLAETDVPHVGIGHEVRQLNEPEAFLAR